MRSVTDNEIIKALECCCEAELKEDCERLKCPFFDNEIYNCMNVDDENAMYRYSLDLINRQQADIVRLRNLLNEAEAKQTSFAKGFYKRGMQDFAERLKNEQETIDLGCGAGSYEYVAVDVINDLLEEMGV